MTHENEQKNNTENNEINQEIQQNENIKETCCIELSEYKNRCLYLAAEFENFKRRTEKEKAQWLFDGENIVLKNILPIIDDFDRAFNAIEIQHLPEESKAYFQGFELILKSFEKLLKQFGVEDVNYDTFDPELHEAVTQIQSDNKQPGEIVEVFQKGYTHKGKLLRAAQVSIAK